MKKRIFSIIVVALMIFSMTATIYAQESASLNSPQFLPKTGDKGTLIDQKNYEMDVDGITVSVMEFTYSAPSKSRSAIRTYYKETFYSVESYGMEKLDADFVVNSDYTVTCPRYYSSYTQYQPMFYNPAETSASFSSGRRLSNGLHYYKIDANYSYRKSQFWNDSYFSMSLTCDSSGGTQ